MKEWFLALDSRERLFVSAGAAAVLVTFLYLGVWDPLVGRVAKLEKTVEMQREGVQWMVRSSAEARALRGSSGPRSKGLGGRSLLAVVDQSARKAGLGPQLKRVEPEGKDAVKVWMENASFDTFITWVGGLSRNTGVEIRAVTIERQDQSGRVNIRVTLTEPGKT